MILVTLVESLRKVLIKVDRIERCQEEIEHRTLINFIDGEWIKVKETVDEIHDQIKSMKDRER